jgi:hypothetical protein
LASTGINPVGGIVSVDPEPGDTPGGGVDRKEVLTAVSKKINE